LFAQRNHLKRKYFAEFIFVLQEEKLVSRAPAPQADVSDVEAAPELVSHHVPARSAHHQHHQRQIVIEDINRLPWTDPEVGMDFSGNPESETDLEKG
jgi:hypothetical protein